MEVTYFAELYWLEASHRYTPLQTLPPGEELTEGCEDQSQGPVGGHVHHRGHWKTDVRARLE